MILGGRKSKVIESRIPSGATTKKKPADSRRKRRILGEINSRVLSRRRVLVVLVALVVLDRCAALAAPSCTDCRYAALKHSGLTALPYETPFLVGPNKVNY